MEKIMDSNREGHEWLLIFVTLLSLLTCKRIKKLERFKQKLAGDFKYF